MKVTGYQLRHAIREVDHLRALVASRWDDSLFAFEGESKVSPEEIMKQFRAFEDRLALLQEVQARYNLEVEVTVQGQTMTLCRAVKLVGGAGRGEKMWRSAAAGEKKDRYAMNRELTRSKDEVRAQRTVSQDTALEAAREAGRFAAALRQAIELGNAAVVEIPGLDASLFE